MSQRVSLKFSSEVVNVLKSPSESFQLYKLVNEAFVKVPTVGHTFQNEYIALFPKNNYTILKILKSSSRIEPESMTKHTIVDIESNHVREHRKILGTYKILNTNEEFTVTENTFIRTPENLFLILVASNDIKQDTSLLSNPLPGVLSFFKNG